MVRRALITILSVAFSIAAMAQTVTDDSDKNIEPAVMTAAVKAISDQMRDPQSSQFRNLYIIDNSLCGEVNSKNGFGAYVGYTPFRYSLDTQYLGILASNTSSEAEYELRKRAMNYCVDQKTGTFIKPKE